MTKLDDTDIPEAFRQFSQSMWLPKDERESASNEVLMREGLKAVSHRDREAVLKPFLDTLLGGSFSNEDLQRLWSRQRPVFLFNGPEMRAFLTMVRDTLAREAS